MNSHAVVSASKQFLKTREASAAAPSIRGLMRHIEANMRLYEAFAPDGVGSLVQRLAFAFWRLMLVAVSETGLLFGKIRQIWRLF